MRLNQFDLLKGICIILVMIGHAIPHTGFLNNLICSFRMPLFFFCSGFFFKERPIKEKITKDVKGLLIPWMTFCVVLIVAAFIIDRFTNPASPLLNFQPLNEDCYILYHTIWFLVCLFVTRLLYTLIAKTHNTLIINTLIGGGYLIAFALQIYEINIPFFIDSALAMLLFYHLGRVFRELGWYTKLTPIWLNACLLLLYALFVYVFAPYAGIKYNSYPIYLPLLVMVPIYALYQLCCRFNSRFLLHCGAVSISILGFHHPIYDVVMSPVFNRVTLPQPIEICLTVGITLIIVLIIHKIIMRYTPFLLGKF